MCTCITGCDWVWFTLKVQISWVWLGLIGYGSALKVQIWCVYMYYWVWLGLIGFDWVWGDHISMYMIVIGFRNTFQEIRYLVLISCKLLNFWDRIINKTFLEFWITHSCFITLVCFLMDEYFSLFKWKTCV